MSKFTTKGPIIIETKMKKSEERGSSKRMPTVAFDPGLVAEAHRQEEVDENPTLVKSILNVLNGPKDSIERLAFEIDPSINNEYHALYKSKVRLLPDTILKRILIQDDLVATIVNARSNQMSSFGRPRPDRFSVGYIIEPKPGVLDKIQNEEKKNELQKRIDVAIEKFLTCGETKGWKDEDQLTFPQYLYMSTRNAIGVGRLATEIIQVEGPDGKKRFHSFRVIDAGTIYKAAPQRTAAEAVRREALHLLEQIKNKKLIPEKFAQDEYAWVQVIESRPVQAFTTDECIVHNFYPVPDVELNGYPVTPLDTVMAAVTTHINITTHNKLYFQAGRATRGMLVIQSDEVDETVVARIRQQFNASINSVNNSWRMPVFGIGPTDQLTWSPIDNGGRDMEFQYLSDMNARVILSAFQMSPEELPGWSYLSRGTNSQALSESNQEFRLEAHRDLGIRPLIAQFEDFINTHLFPLIDEELAKHCELKLVGLDAETAEKESVRIQEDQLIHMTYSEIMEKVEKKPIARHMGGHFPLNPNYQQVLDKYCTVGEIKEYFFGIEGAKKDPRWDYVRDPFYFQNIQLQMQAQQMQMQAQQQAQQAAAGGPPPGGDGGGGAPPSGGGDSGGGGDAGGQQAPTQESNVQTEKEKSASVEQSSAGGDSGGEDLSRSLDQAIALLSKSEAQLPPSKRRLLAQHKATLDHFNKQLEEDVQKATDEILATIRG